VFQITTSYSQTKPFKVTLDAGHGDQDFGAVYFPHIEKKINLAIVLKVGKILEDYPGIEVIYTRKTDVFIGLIERANIANRADSNIFVSIHCNANGNTAASGSETYVMGMSKNASNLEAAKRENQVITMEKDYKQKYEGFDPNRPESMLGMTLMQEEFIENSIMLAGKIQDHFVKDNGRKSRGGGVKQERFMVLHKAYMPRVLIETGFISNPEEGKYLDSEEGQKEVAKAIAEAIISYKKENFDGGSNDDFIERPSVKSNTQISKSVEPVKKTDIVEKKSGENEISKETETVVIFKIQLSASSKNIELSPSNFKGLKNISSTFENKLYKYTYGSTSNYDEAKKLLADAKSKGYTSAYIIAFNNGKSITIKEALKN
jgi:N-acetylmuramoyl-L-alanine amidase